MAILTDPELWRDNSSDTPPIWWEAIEEDERYWFYYDDVTDTAPLTAVTILDVADLTESITFEWEVVTPYNPGDATIQLFTIRNAVQTNVEIPNEVGSGSITVYIPDGTTTFSWGIRAYSSFVENRMYGGVVAVGAPCEAINFNCDCTDEIGDSYPTLAALRRRLMIRLGFAVQADSPPPGMAVLLDDFLASAQTQLWNKHKELRSERFFTWVMEPGVRLYDLHANEEACTLKLDPLKLTWVGIEDAGACDNGTWLPLDAGIPPEYYTTVTSWGMPSCYEIRQCIEVFPAPDRAYRLRIKGHFAQTPFVTGTDQCSIDGELLFLWALSDAKAHYGKPDAGNIRAAAVARLGDMKAGRHGTKRYIPNASVALNVAKPIFLPLVGEE